MAISYSQRSRDTVRAAIRSHVRYDTPVIEYVRHTDWPRRSEVILGGSRITTRSGQPCLPHCGRGRGAWP